MLCISATYKSRLGFMIERQEVVTLLDRTIRFLKSHKPISYTLGQDAAILEGILATIDKPLPVMPVMAEPMKVQESTSTSFSSNKEGAS
jgi:hypothetical protein